MHIVAELKISITVRAPFLTQSSAPEDYGLDAVLARDNEKRFYIPGTLIIGKLRQAWQELKSLQTAKFKPKIDDWLGKTSDPNQEIDEPENTVLPQRKRLYIENLILSETGDEPEKSKNSPNFRIRMNSERGVVDHGAYIVTERPFVAGEKIIFQGIAHFLATNKQEIKEFYSYLKTGLQWISQLGANRTIGFGEVIEVDVKQPIPISSVQAKRLPISENAIYDLCIRPQSPFCIAERRIFGNLFQSSKVIPGNVIKGTIANMWIALLGGKTNQVNEGLDKNRPELIRHFDALRFTHAFPSTQQQTRPVIPPLSLVKDTIDKEVYDIALCEGPVLIKERAPEFAVDWKKHSDVEERFGWPSIKQELRVRTAIESEKRRARENQLFAYEMVVPENDLAWYAHLDLSAVLETDRPKVVEQLQSLLAQGVTGLGKTKAYTHIELLPEKTVKLPNNSHFEIALKEGVWIVTLQTPALLCNPHELNASQVDNLKQAYSNVWHQLSGGSLQLSMERFFATQSLAGGFYLWKRFQKTQTYQPYLLTDAGSVFVLSPQKGKEQHAQECIEKWCLNGLPVPKWAIKEYKLSDKPEEQWSNCPYIPQNGYGEIAVNLPIHWDRNPQNKKVKVELIHQEKNV